MLNESGRKVTVKGESFKGDQFRRKHSETPLSAVSLSTVSVSHSPLQYENSKWKIPEIIPKF